MLARFNKGLVAASLGLAIWGATGCSSDAGSGSLGSGSLNNAQTAGAAGALSASPGAVSSAVGP